MACQNQKCIDPCPGTCGIEARCQVINHYAACSCPPGYTGDPFNRCTRIKCKHVFSFPSTFEKRIEMGTCGYSLNLILFSNFKTFLIQFSFGIEDGKCIGSLTKVLNFRK